MELGEYREYFINEINAQAVEENKYKEDVFIDNITDILVNDFSMLSGLEQCYFDFNRGNKAFKNMHIDAGSLELSTNTLNLLIVDFNESEIINLNNEFINSKIQLMINYFENCLKGFFTSAEQANAAVQLALDIRKNFTAIYKIHLFITSTNKLSERVKTINLPNIVCMDKSYKVELDIIDIIKVFNTKLPTFEKEEIVIDVTDFNEIGIPCIKADIEADNYEAYLAIVPGEFLSDIYKKYGPRLLEGNVRSFLNVRGAVNKGIRGTILNEKDKFFTYNNGISTTAKSISLKEIPGKGLCITTFSDLQIINGGQTTASLVSASIKDNADLSHIFIQMKLTIVKKDDPDFVINISKYANSQNKVTAADLNSNHPFYARIEDYSRKIYAPTINNQTYQTLWFFERSRGQYDQPKMKMTKAERDRYDRINPKNQKVSKTDLAKYLNSAEMKPYDVAWGAEVNAIRFQSELEDRWNKNNLLYNELFYKDLIAKAILFKAIEKTISNQEWYKENKAYRAQLVTYAFSKLIYSTNQLKKVFNYSWIWDKQGVPDFVFGDIAIIAKLAYDTIYDPNRQFTNVGEYCKRKICWENLSDKKFEFSEKTLAFLKDESEVKVEKIQAKKNQKFTNSLTIEIQVFNEGSPNWKRLLEKGNEQKLLTTQDEIDLHAAIEYCNGLKQLSSIRCAKIWEIKNKLIDSHVI